MLNLHSRDASPFTTRHTKRDQNEMSHSPVSPANKSARITHQQYTDSMQDSETTPAASVAHTSSTRTMLDALHAKRAQPKPRVQFTNEGREKFPKNNNNIVKEQAVDAWRSCRTAFLNAQRARVRASHIDVLTNEQLFPDWAHGISATPSHLLPLNEDKRQYALLSQQHAQAKLQFISERLNKYASAQTNTGAHLENSVQEHYTLPEEQQLFCDSQSKLIAMIERDIKTLQERLNKSLNYHRTNPTQLSTLQEHLLGGRNETPLRQRSRSNNRAPKRRRATSTDNRQDRSKRPPPHNATNANQQRGRQRDRRTPNTSNTSNSSARSARNAFTLTARERAIIDSLRIDNAD